MYLYLAASYGDTAAAARGGYYADGGNPNLPSYYGGRRGTEASARNQMNFHKKITYAACSKTLAESRPRIRGRFAKNGDTETETASYDCYSCGSNCNYHNEWWRQMHAALGTTEEGEVCGYDEDLLSSFLDVFSMNLLS